MASTTCSTTTKGPVRAHICSPAPTAVTRSGGVTPTPYPIPHDGPVGRMLGGDGALADARIASALHGFGAGISHAGDAHLCGAATNCLDSDTVFGVKDSLIKDFLAQPPGTPAPNGRDLSGSGWSRVRFDIGLAPRSA